MSVLALVLVFALGFFAFFIQCHQWSPAYEFEKILQLWASLFLAIFFIRPIQTVIAGHSHIYQRGERNGITYVIMGGGGATLESPLERVANWSMYDKTLFTHHYGWLERRPGSGGWQWRVYDIHNALIDSVNVTGSGY